MDDRIHQIASELVNIMNSPEFSFADDRQVAKLQKLADEFEHLKLASQIKDFLEQKPNQGYHNLFSCKNICLVVSACVVSYSIGRFLNRKFL